MTRDADFGMRGAANNVVGADRGAEFFSAVAVSGHLAPVTRWASVGGCSNRSGLRVPGSVLIETARGPWANSDGRGVLVALMASAGLLAAAHCRSR